MNALNLQARKSTRAIFFYLFTLYILFDFCYRFELYKYAAGGAGGPPHI